MKIEDEDVGGVGAVLSGADILQRAKAKKKNTVALNFTLKPFLIIFYFALNFGLDHGLTRDYGQRSFDT